MSSLPPELAAWTEVLAGFAPDLAEPVGLLARRLDLVIGRVRARPRPHGDDPDGYDGLDRRGPYDRLVLSEWALADAVPEEFDRRAAAGEQSFLRLDRRDRTKGVRCVAFFDGGPDQLGSPRVVQLAALVVLWRRARASHATFRWGPLAGGALHETVDRATVQAFLGARQGLPATAADLLAARARAGDVDEVWLVGPPAPEPLVSLAPRAGQPTPLLLALSEVVAPDVRAVDVRLSRGGASLGEARLDLPAPALTRRLLVDPFREAPAPARPATPPPVEPSWRPFPRGGRDPSLVRFVPGTEQLVTVLAGGLVFSWGFEAGRLKSPKPKQHAIPDEPLVALGYHRQRAIALTWTAPATSPERALRASWFGSPIPHQRISDPTPQPGAGTVVAADGKVLFLDATGALGFLLTTVPEPWVVPLAEEVALLFTLQQQILYLVRVGSRLELREHLKHRESNLLAELPGEQAWTADDGRLLVTQGPEGVQGWELSYGGPATLQSMKPVTLPELPPGYPRLLGIARRSLAPIVCDERVARIHHMGTDVTIAPPRPPIDPTVSGDGTVVAWRTEEGFVEAWSLLNGAPLIQRHAG